MANNAEHLEAIFLKENLAKTDVVNLLAGHRVRLAKGYGGESTVYNLVTGEAVAGSKAKDIIARWRSLKEIWESSTHGRSEIGLTFDPTADDMMIPRNYVLWWTWNKHKPTSTIWKGFNACLKHGLEQEWIKPQDYVPQEETEPQKQEPEPIKDKPVSQREIDGLLRLVGAMRDILTSKDGEIKGLKKNFTSNNDLLNHILENYEGEGLSVTTIKKRFEAGQEIIKHTKK